MIQKKRLLINSSNVKRRRNEAQVFWAKLPSEVQAEGTQNNPIFI